MKLQTFKIFKLCITALLAAIIAISVSTGSWYLPGIVIVASAFLLLTLKRKITELTEDERDRQVGGKAALMAMTIYAILSAIVGTTLVAFDKDNMIYYAIGSALLYGPSFFIILYAILFKIYARKESQD